MCRLDKSCPAGHRADETDTLSRVLVVLAKSRTLLVESACKMVLVDGEGVADLSTLADDTVPLVDDLDDLIAKVTAMRDASAKPTGKPAKTFKAQCFANPPDQIRASMAGTRVAMEISDSVPIAGSSAMILELSEAARLRDWLAAVVDAARMPA